MTPSKPIRFVAWLTLASFFSSNVLAVDPVNIATVPLVSMSTKVVRPNVMFILDDSGSMDSDYMPDDNWDDTKACFYNWGWNKIAYNPSITYFPPKNPDGSPFVNANPASAWDNGFNSSGGPRNLAGVTAVATPNTTVLTLANNSIATSTAGNGRTVTVTVPSTANMAVGMSVSFAGVVPNARVNNIRINGRTYPITQIVSGTVFKFDTSGVTNDVANATSSPAIGTAATVTFTWNTFVNQANYFYYSFTASPNAPPSTCAADASYTKVGVSSLTAAQQQNYANWYSFYRTRLMMMKSAAGRAFSGIDDEFRVGYTTISERGTAAARWLGNARFDAVQKTSWYGKLYGAATVGWTPLRGALSKAGRYYAGRLVTGNDDPVQYSCQKNFAILTTDGYWNKHDETATYGPKREDNVTDVGDQDGVLSPTDRPKYEAGHYSNTLADIALYYNKTDLRTTNALGGLQDDGVTRSDVSPNIKDTQGNDLPDGHQHMTTITLGLGMSGERNYPGDAPALKSGALDWPDPQTGVSGDNTTIPARLDDLWHAAVNGDGTYATASTPEEAVAALRAALATITDKGRSGAAAATSSLEPVTGDNFAYIAQYTTARWTGDIEAHTIDLATGNVSGTIVWSALAKAEGTVGTTTDTRRIYTSSSAGTRVDFVPGPNVNAAYFNASALSQWGVLSAAQQARATPVSLINYIRGQHGFELRSDATHTDPDSRLYRARQHKDASDIWHNDVIGDIIDSSPVYVRKPPFRYADTGYAAFVGTQAGRGATVYAGANDGMLHAFDASPPVNVGDPTPVNAGTERWAYIPRMLHSQLYKLADTNYANNHNYYVNGVVTVGDAYNGSSWRTVLIAGLGAGGRGYFALDVTDPANPSVLWEFTDANLGKSFGNPILTKRASDGMWVVLFTSGYNNVSPGDGQGRLYMVNAFTGAQIGSGIVTTAGTNANLSGLSKITNWVLDTMVDNSTQYVYGGDLAGNLWRFDINAMTVVKLGQTSAVPGARPITSRPEVARIRDASGVYHRVVYVGTGRYLGGTDVSGASVPELTRQVLLAVKDDLPGPMTPITFDSSGGLIQQTLVDVATSPPTRAIPSASAAAVNWSSNNGWYVMLPDLGERVTVEPRLQLGTVSFVSNRPRDEYCSLGGSSWLYALDYRTGTAISTQATSVVGMQVDSHTIGTGLTVVRLPNGHLVAIVNTPDGTRTLELPTGAAGAGSVRRVGYREIN